MIDDRIQQAQRLFWEIETLRVSSAQRAIAVRLEQMAYVHELRARELLARRDPDGWIDLFAAITAWGDAGSERRARDLVDTGKAEAAAFDGQEFLLGELDVLEARLRDQRIVPALSDFARHSPEIPEGRVTFEPSLPRVVAFYAYKGGTGRTTAMVRTAWALAREGRRIVMVDFDLSAPSLWYLMFPDEPVKEGFVEYLAHAEWSPETNATSFLHSVKLDDDAKGELHLLGAGKMDAAYLQYLANLDWQRLLGPGRSLDSAGQVTFGESSLFDRFCNDLSAVADAIFIDAPTGLNDTANVCLRSLADLAVIIFTPSRVQIEGIGRVVALLAEEQAEGRGKPDVLCVASTLHAHRLTLDQMRRVDHAFDYLEKVRYDALGKPALEDPEKLDAMIQPRTHIPYEPSFADVDEMRLDRAPNRDDMSLYEGLVLLLRDAIPARTVVRTSAATALDAPTKRGLLDDLKAYFPPPVAQQETDREASFLRTTHVRRVADPGTILVHGGKGSGKTALFLHYLALSSVGVRHVAVHGLPGQPELGMDVLSEMVEAGFPMDVVWRAYALARVDDLPHEVPAAAREAVQELVAIMHGDVRFRGSSSTLRVLGLGTEVDAAWRIIDSRLERSGERLVLFFDGLDAPFKGSLERRRTGLSQLFIAWQATFERLRHVQLKIFLRTDLWHEISFPEKSHVQTRAIELTWSSHALWQLLLKRALRSQQFADRCSALGIAPSLTWKEVEESLEPTLLPYLDALFEQRIWTGKTALSRNWIRRRLTDAREILYPRDALTLLRSAIAHESDRLNSRSRTSGEAVISRESLAAALGPTSEQRVQAVLEESPELLEVIQHLKGFNAQGDLDDLRMHLAKRSGAEATADLERLRRNGVLSTQERDPAMRYAIAELYVPGLQMKRPGPK